MKQSELVVLEGEINKLSTSEQKTLLNDPDLLGVWITAALTAAKGLGKGVKGIKKLVKKKKQLKRAKAKKAALKSAIAKAPAPAPAAVPSMISTKSAFGPVPEVSPGMNKMILPLAAAAVLLLLIMSKK